MKGNTDKVKGFIRKFGLLVRKLERRSSDMFSPLNYFVDEISVETTDAGFDQCIKNHLVYLQSEFYKYFQK
jgi:hypothetical protein